MVSRALALAAAAAAASACEGKRGSGAPAAGGSPEAPAALAPEAAPAVSPEAAKLPGVLWFVEEEPGRRLVRLASGARAEVTTDGGDLYPMAQTMPDGRLVAIVSRGDGGPGSEQLALVGPGGAVARIGPAAVSVRNPAVDPRGRWIVVAANTDGHSDLYRIDPVTGAAPRLTNDPQGNFAPARLGDDALVFASSRDGDSEIYRMPAAGGKPQRLTAFHRDDWAPVPSPDGKTIAFLSDREGPARVFLMAADGTGVRRLTGRAEKDRDEAAPVWSPDGGSIAYLVTGKGESNLWLRDVATGRERVLTPLRELDAEPCFSPDGAWIAVARGATEHDADLWAVPTAPGGAPLRLTARPGPERMPRWLP